MNDLLRQKPILEEVFAISLKEIFSIPGIKAVFFTLFMTSFGFGVILPIIPFYSTSLGATPFQIGMLTATFALMSLIFSPIMGKLSDRIGRKKVLAIGTIGFVAAYVIFGFANSLYLTFVARAIEGIAAAGMFPASISLLSDLTNEKQRGRAMGIVGMAFSLGFIIGPAFGGIASAISVRDAFLLSALLAGLNFISVNLQMREPLERKESKDIVQKEITLLEHLSSPLLLLFLASFMITFMIGGLDATLALYTSQKLGFTSTQVGLIFTYVGVLIMVWQLIGGNLVNRFGEIRLVQTGILISGLGFLMLSLVSGWASLLLPLGIFVTGSSLVFPSVSSLLTKKVTSKRGVALGLNSSFSSLGQMIGPLLGGFFFSISHIYAFIGLATVTLSYFLIFSLVGSKKLQR